MIETKNLSHLKNWFSEYVHTFKNEDSELQKNIDLKEEHTKRVCKEILYIGKRLGLNDNELRLAEIIALFHDIGRFEQYTRYKTFMDGKSENHAELGVKILLNHEVLKEIDNETVELILCSIKYHNRSLVPNNETEKCLFFTKLLRDADKLDIWKVVTDYYHRKNKKPNGAIELGLPDTPGFSKEVKQDLLNKTFVDMSHVNNLNDFKLLQVGWIFDINFKPTFECIKQRRYLELIQKVLPKTKEIKEIFDFVITFQKEHNITHVPNNDAG